MPHLPNPSSVDHLNNIWRSVQVTKQYFYTGPNYTYLDGKPDMIKIYLNCVGIYMRTLTYMLNSITRYLTYSFSTQTFCSSLQWVA